MFNKTIHNTTVEEVTRVEKTVIDKDISPDRISQKYDEIEREIVSRIFERGDYNNIVNLRYIKVSSVNETMDNIFYMEIYINGQQNIIKFSISKLINYDELTYKISEELSKIFTKMFYREFLDNLNT